MTVDETDDPSISDDENLLRRIPNSPTMWKFDSNTNQHRLTSACFTDRETQDREVSVTLETPLLKAGKMHEDCLTDHEDFGLVKIRAGFVRHEINPAQKVIRQPTPADPHHGLIVGRKRRQQQKQMAKNCSFVIKPSGLLAIEGL